MDLRNAYTEELSQLKEQVWRYIEWIDHLKCDQANELSNLIQDHDNDKWALMTSYE